MSGEPLTTSGATSGVRRQQEWRPLLPDFTYTPHQGPTSTLLRGSNALTGTETLERGVVVGHGIRCRNRAERAGVAVGHGITSRSRISTLGHGAGTIGRTGALPALVNTLHRVTINAVESPGRRLKLDLSLSYIERVREEVSVSYKEGQRAMTQMGELLTMSLTKGAHECRSTVRAELWESNRGEHDMDKMQFSLSESFPASHLRTSGAGSLELAQAQLRGLVVDAAGEWRGARVVDHSLDFDVLENNDSGVMRIIAHAR
jgi:hypothetical protein